MRVVQLSRLRLLTLLVERRRHPSQMGQEGGERQPREHLGHTSLEYVVVLVLAPVACGESCSYAVGDGVTVEVVGEAEASVFLQKPVMLNVPLQLLLHISDHFSELLSKDLRHQPPRHVQSLLAVVVAIVFSRSTQSRLDQAIGHITDEESFFELVPRLDPDVRKQVVPENTLGKLDPTSLLVDATGIGAVTIGLDQLHRTA